MLQKLPESNSIDCNLSSSIWDSVCVGTHLYIYINNNIFAIKETHSGKWWNTREQRTTHGHHLYALVKMRIFNSPTLSSIPSAQVDSERLFGFSLIQSQSNVNCGLILHDYECTEMILDENSAIHVNRGWMGISLALTGIQWFVGYTTECIMERE